MQDRRPRLLAWIAATALATTWLLAEKGASEEAGTSEGSGSSHAPSIAPGVQLSTVCANCHSASAFSDAMEDRAGRTVAPYDLWRSTMMANSARDPLWRAVVSAEVAATPSRQREIEAACLSCHAPMADQVGLDDHGTGTLMHVVECESTLGDLARDGVSCTICHGITDEGLGTEASFSAGFVLDQERRLYGPHRDPFANPMRMRSGFTPTHGEHILDAGLCGSCHTLETETFEADGQLSGEVFLEQAPYLEWRNSIFNDEVSEPGPAARACQACHVPTHDLSGRRIQTRLARNPTGGNFTPLVDREPFGRHVFVGGNTLVLSMLREHAEELGVEAPRESFDATLEATRDQLQRRTVQVSIEGLQRDGGQVRFGVALRNLTGHKFPTGHPTRRAWIRVVLRDAEGAVVFASGAVDAGGRIVDGEGLPLPSEAAGGPISPHRNEVSGEDQVVLYQAVMADSAGATTHTLVRAARWKLDDRLLPAGWDPGAPEAERTAPVGVEGDPDFLGGSDVAHYRIDDPGPGSLELEVSVLYQTLGARWADELFRWDTPEIRRFRRMYEAAEARFEVLVTEQRSF